jgi:hypothetical protein
MNLFNDAVRKQTTSCPIMVTVRTGKGFNGSGHLIDVLPHNLPAMAEEKPRSRITSLSHNPMDLDGQFFNIALPKRKLISKELTFLYLLTYGAEPFLRSCQLCSHSGNSQQF